MYKLPRRSARPHVPYVDFFLLSRVLPYRLRLAFDNQDLPIQRRHNAAPARSRFSRPLCLYLLYSSLIAGTPEVAATIQKLDTLDR